MRGVLMERDTRCISGLRLVQQDKMLDLREAWLTRKLSVLLPVEGLPKQAVATRFAIITGHL